MAAEVVARRRRALTHIRRAVGMALNGVLTTLDDGDADTLDALTARWGRSYMDHLRALSTSDDPTPLPGAAPGWAQAILAVPLQPPSTGLVALRTGADAGMEAVEAALNAGTALLAACEQVCADV